MIWLSPSDHAGIPIDVGTGEVLWKVQSRWKLADFLPPAVRPSLLLYAGELLLGPQRELGRRFGTSANSRLPGEDLAATDAADAAGADMEVDAEERKATCMDEEEDDGDAPACGADAEMPAAEGEGESSEAAAAAAASAEAATKAAEEGGEQSGQATKALEELQTFIQDSYFEALRRRVLRYLEDLQVQKQRELPDNISGGDTAGIDAEGLDSDSEEDEEEEDTEERREAKEVRKQERLRRHLLEKWSFPEIPGRKAPPGSVEVEFMRSLIKIFMLDDSVVEQVEALRERMCQKIKVSSFQHHNASESTCFPLILRDVTCPWCCVANHVDVTSHPVRGPGLWICQHCDRVYDKDAMQARLVDLLHSIVQAWQSQEVTCKKCRGLRTSNLQNFCECFGRYQLRFSGSDFHLVLRVLGSLTGPHDLPWLEEMLQLHQLAA
eukprot:TRINITY_DN35360_c0_g1_i2.p1 TRINITY_DN35360_c0_g1~~TRINITY_DN35360_c0_g1_i2.p1  ORF type:complete len:438 (+),score=125.16 TRINITY_DN35360_c0_g1_i2:171-1484(+)